MAECFTVKSRLREYEVCFVADCVKAIGNQQQEGSFLVIDPGLPEDIRQKVSACFARERVITFVAREENKTLPGCERLIRKLVLGGMRRGNRIYAVGGGVVQDAVAFVSTMLYRGVEWFFCPTTLLAQADSCIGSKSSINFGAAKNLLGTFYPPSKIIIDVRFLRTLSASELRSGLGEILHYLLLAGKLPLARKMMADSLELLRDPGLIRVYIEASLRIKKPVVEMDEQDKGIRNLFNYGHTFGHAVESVSRYRVNHGQAVTLGMDLANYISCSRGHITQPVFDVFHKILKSNLPDFSLSPRTFAGYLQALRRDKKNAADTLGCILTRGPGKMFRVQIPFDERLASEIRGYFALKTAAR